MSDCAPAKWTKVFLSGIGKHHSRDRLGGVGRGASGAKARCATRVGNVL